MTTDFWSKLLQMKTILEILSLLESEGIFVFTHYNDFPPHLKYVNTASYEN